MRTETIKVVRPFILDGSPTKVGQVIEVPASLGIELRTAKKAVLVDPPVVEPKPELKAAKVPQKGDK